jgi:hypothetical protein
MNIDDIYYHKYNKYKKKYLLEKNNLIIKGGADRFRSAVTGMLGQTVFPNNELIKHIKDNLLKCTSRHDKEQCITNTKLSQVKYLKTNIINEIQKNEDNTALKNTLFDKLKLIKKLDNLYDIGEVDMKNFILRKLALIICNDSTNLNKTLNDCEKQELTKHETSLLSDQLIPNTKDKYKKITSYLNFLLPDKTLDISIKTISELIILIYEHGPAVGPLDKKYSTLTKGDSINFLTREEYIKMANYVLNELAYIISSNKCDPSNITINDCTKSTMPLKPPSGSWVTSENEAKDQNDSDIVTKYNNILLYSSILLDNTPGYIIKEPIQKLVQDINSKIEQF